VEPAGLCCQNAGMTTGLPWRPGSGQAGSWLEL
jgi:hypothetical protein